MFILVVLLSVAQLQRPLIASPIWVHRDGTETFYIPSSIRYDSNLYASDSALPELVKQEVLGINQQTRTMNDIILTSQFLSDDSSETESSGAKPWQASGNAGFSATSSSSETSESTFDDIESVDLCHIEADNETASVDDSHEAKFITIPALPKDEHIKNSEQIIASNYLDEPSHAFYYGKLFSEDDECQKASGCCPGLKKFRDWLKKPFGRKKRNYNVAYKN